jgi:hypothetical protein
MPPAAPGSAFFTVMANVRVCSRTFPQERALATDAAARARGIDSPQGAVGKIESNFLRRNLAK